MVSLNLPSFDIKIVQIDGNFHVFDTYRKKYLLLTPEEWVRQHFINLLVKHYQYPSGLLKMEGGLKYHQLKKRTDIVVFDTQGNPFLLVECKAADVPLNQAVVEQASRYNRVLKCPYVVVTNGMKTYCFKVDFENNAINQCQDLPIFPKNE